MPETDASRLDWENRYLSGDTPWDKGQPCPPLVEFTRRVSLSGRVLMPGCGTGNDARWLATCGLDVVGLDLAPTALERARVATPAELKVEWTVGDFFNLPSKWHGTFDGVVEHTCFCAILPEQRTDYVQSCVQLIKPGGFLLGIFYRDPDSEIGPPFGCTLDELDHLFSDAFELIEDYIPTTAFAGREGKEQVRFYRKRF